MRLGQTKVGGEVNLELPGAKENRILPVFIPTPEVPPNFKSSHLKNKRVRNKELQDSGPLLTIIPEVPITDTRPCFYFLTLPF